MASKNRLAQVKKMSIDRIELCAAVMNKRLKSFIEKEFRYQFSECYHIVDSQNTQIVRAMTVSNTSPAAIDIARYSSYTKLIRVSARVIAITQRKPKPSLRNAVRTLTPTDIEKAETFWIQKAQESMKH